MATRLLEFKKFVILTRAEGAYVIAEENEDFEGNKYVNPLETVIMQPEKKGEEYKRWLFPILHKLIQDRIRMKNVVGEVVNSLKGNDPMKMKLAKLLED